MASAIIAALAALMGASLSTLLQQRGARRERQAADAEAHRQALITAVAALVTALAAHRRAMWVREDARLTGAGPEKLAAARAESHATRAAVTGPHTRLVMLAPPPLAQAADDATEAAYALRHAPDTETLTARREAARAAGDALVYAARAHLAAR
ncbi:hypothetical protein GCM10023347_07750 [Streptomyces chumphonensis]|uniref:Protein kilB n=1 Tax=Streptomyces chumphonensis TaxID=1214925 RepID=A0A927F4G4_9ACTN|nr:protein kilB [Streptomyces chumphonensis]MBD3934835.1 protein kilB [Streptomyces chumphonensis]